MQKYGCLQKFTAIVQQLHDGMIARVMHDGDVLEAFHVTNGVKQGFVRAPTLLYGVSRPAYRSLPGLC